MTTTISSRVAARVAMTEDRLASLELARHLLAAASRPERVLDELGDSLAVSVRDMVGIADSTAIDITHLTEAMTRYEAEVQRTVTDALVKSLQSPTLGFSSVEVKPDAADLFMEARLGHSILRARVDEHGSIMRDWMVGPGDACTVLDNLLVEDLRRQGIETTIVEIDHHGGLRDGARVRRPDSHRTLRSKATSRRPARRVAGSAL
jgi:hypothetical protein